MATAMQRRSYVVKKNLVRAILGRVKNCTPQEAVQTVDLILEEVKAAIANGKRVEIRGLGVFSSGKKRVGMARNVRRGTVVPIPDGLTVRFKAGKFLKAMPLDGEEA